jgi:hypothetical protein
MQHAYTTLNKKIQAAWATVAPGLPILFATPMDNTVRLPPECLRVYWLNYGELDANTTEQVGLVQLDVYTDNDQRALALTRAKALADALGFVRNSRLIPFPLIDYTQTPNLTIGRMRLNPLATQWRDVSDPSPNIIHLARRIEPIWTSY